MKRYENIYLNKCKLVYNADTLDFSVCNHTAVPSQRLTPPAKTLKNKKTRHTRTYHAFTLAMKPSLTGFPSKNEKRIFTSSAGREAQRTIEDNKIFASRNPIGKFLRGLVLLGGPSVFSVFHLCARVRAADEGMPGGVPCQTLLHV